MADEQKPKEGEEKPDPVMDVLKDMKEQLDKLPKEGDKSADEKPVSTVPSYADQRAALQKRLGFTDEQMSAHEEMLRISQAPLVEKSGWDSIATKTHFSKYKEEIDKEVALYPAERRTPEIMTKIYQMIVGRHAESAPVPEPKKPEGRVASSRVSGGPGYSGTEGGGSGDKGPEDKSEELNEGEAITAKKLGVDPKRFALSRNSGKDITPLRKPADMPAASTGADLELRRMQGTRR